MMLTRSLSRCALAALLFAAWTSTGWAQGAGETKSEPHPSPPAEETEEEEEATFTWGADVDLVSKYVWRGFVLNDNVSIQPNVWGSAYGFTVSAWFQLATEKLSDQLPGEFDEDTGTVEEFDLTVSYARDFGKFSLEGGLLRYMYPGIDGVDPSNELFLTVGYDYWLAPSVGVYRDLDVESTYFELGIGPEFEVAPKLTLNPGVVLGIYHFGDNEDLEIEAFNAHRLEPSAALNYDLGRGISATAHLHYVIPITDEDESGIESRLWGGVGAHISL
jgi:hypothetical protein